MLLDVEDAPEAAVRQPVVKCNGLAVNYMFGHPFVLNFPTCWPAIFLAGVAVDTTHGILHARECTDAAESDMMLVPDALGRSGGAVCCKKCAALKDAEWLKKAAVSAAKRGEEAMKLNFAYCTIEQLRETNGRRKLKRDALSLAVTSSLRSLNALHSRVELHVRVLQAVAESDAPRLSALVATSLRAGRGPAYIAGQIARASSGEYHPKGFRMHKRDIMALVLRMGHRGLAFAVAHALGLPSITSTLRYLQSTGTGIAVLHSSFGKKAAIKANLQRAVKNIDASLKEIGRSSDILMLALQFDATVITSGPGFCRTQKMLTGLCQCCKDNVQTTDYSKMVELAAAVEAKTIHMASNVEIVSIVSVCGVLKNIEPVCVRSICASKADDTAETISMIQAAWREDGFEIKYGPFAQAGRDGASALSAGYQARMSLPAAPWPAGTYEEDELHPRMQAVYGLLQKLPAFDLRYDKFGCVDNPDLRHILKRVLKDWVENGAQVGSVFLTSTILRFAVGVGLGKARSGAAVNSLFAMNDKMRVPAALTFLHALSVFGSESKTGAFKALADEAGVAAWASERSVLAAIELVGVWAGLVTAPVDDLPVREVLKRVSALARLTLALQLGSPRSAARSGSSRFVTSEINRDIQQMAVAVYQHVATAVIVAQQSGETVFALTHLEGSDKTEELFGAMRRSRQTFSMEEVGATLQAALDCNTILIRHQNWRRRDVRRDLRETQLGNRSDDHMGHTDFTEFNVMITNSDDFILPAAWVDGKALGMAACMKAAAAGVSFSRGGVDFVNYVFKQLGVKKDGASAATTLVCPITPGQPLGVAAPAASKAPAPAAVALA